MIKKILFITIFIVSLLANDAQNLKKMVQEKSDLVVSILRDKSIQRDEQDLKIQSILHNMLDYDLMAKLSIGKTSWKLLNEQQQKEYTELFTEHIEKSYYEKLHLLSNQEVIVEDSKNVKSRIFVVSQVKSIKDSTELIYKFYSSKNNKWLVYDIEIAGVSIIQSYRTQFQEIVKEDNPLKLIEKLKSLKKS